MLDTLVVVPRKVYLCILCKIHDLHNRKIYQTWGAPGIGKWKITISEARRHLGGREQSITARRDQMKIVRHTTREYGKPVCIERAVIKTNGAMCSSGHELLGHGNSSCENENENKNKTQG